MEDTTKWGWNSEAKHQQNNSLRPLTNTTHRSHSLARPINCWWHLIANVNTNINFTEVIFFQWQRFYRLFSPDIVFIIHRTINFALKTIILASLRMCSEFFISYGIFYCENRMNDRKTERIVGSEDKKYNEECTFEDCQPRWTVAKMCIWINGNRSRRKFRAEHLSTSPNGRTTT